MTIKVMAITFFLMFAAISLSFSEENEESNSSVPEHRNVNENVKFKCNQDLFNNKANEELKNKAEEAQGKGEILVMLKF